MLIDAKNLLVYVYKLSKQDTKTEVTVKFVKDYQKLDKPILDPRNLIFFGQVIFQ